MTGSLKLGTPQLLKVFDDAVVRHFGTGHKPVKNWFEAFGLLRDLLVTKLGERLQGAERIEQEQPQSDCKHVVFIDEMPWFDRGKSGFLAALEHFWNDWGSSRPDLLMVVCGSSTSWIVKRLFRDKGGLHNRVTARIALKPFTLRECDDYFRYLGVVLNRYQVMESYMVFGGIPFYMGMFDKRYSLTQNVDRLLFNEGAPLKNEYQELFASLFQNPARHTAIIEALTARQFGLTRDEIAQKTRLPLGGSLTNTLDELEQCGFITRFSDFTRPKRTHYYKLTDPFMLFYLKYVQGNLRGNLRGNDTRDEYFWTNYKKGAAYNAWSGLAFEQLCALHVLQMRRALGISGISTQLSSWRSAAADPGAQVDLLIDRRDDVINLCEMKFAAQPLTIDREMDEALQRKAQVFAAETGTRKALHITVVSPYGLSESGYHGSVQSQVTMDDLFA
jgi:hypothetical protein